MGPRPRGRGNHTVRTVFIDNWMLQWDRDQLVTEMPLFCGHTSVSMGPRPSGRGNNSTALRFPCPKSASMGPRLSSRGNRRKLQKSVPLERASMGPRPISRGNFEIPPPAEGWPGKLQWGRDQLVAEITQKESPRKGSQAASMGPRLISRGNYSSNIFSILSPKLQWGRDQLVVEITITKSENDPCAYSGYPKTLKYW